MVVTDGKGKMGGYEGRKYHIILAQKKTHLEVQRGKQLSIEGVHREC
jgi:hypothetical protein